MRDRLLCPGSKESVGRHVSLCSLTLTVVLLLVRLHVCSCFVFCWRLRASAVSCCLNRDLFIEMHFGPKRYVDPEPFANSLLLDPAIQQVCLLCSSHSRLAVVVPVCSCVRLQQPGQHDTHVGCCGTIMACCCCATFSSSPLLVLVGLIEPAGRPGVPQAAAEQAGSCVRSLTAQGGHVLCTGAAYCGGTSALGLHPYRTPK